MNILIGCECSGVVRDAFRALGHNAWSCDLKADEQGSMWHIQEDVLSVIRSVKWDMLIAHPPCTFLANSGSLHLYYKGRDGRRTRRRDASRWSDMIEGAELFTRLWNCGIPKICLENPVMHGHAKSLIGCGQATQTIQPHEFRENASKRTCLWLRGLPKLEGTGDFPPRMVPHNGKLVPRWANQTASGQNKLPPSAGRQAERSRTYQGIADAMAAQWGGEFELT